MRSLLSSPRLYVGLQKALGADRLRSRCIELARITPGDVVVDVGCANAYYLGELPVDIAYYGFDTSDRYVQDAEAKWGDRGSFSTSIFDESTAAELAPIDVVLLLGVIHHLSDIETSQLFGAIAPNLAPDGRIVAVDTAFKPGQGRLSRALGERDRGEHVRFEHEYVALAEQHFRVDATESLDRVTRVPGNYFVMSMSSASTT